jgi:hypothetical protein
MAHAFPYQPEDEAGEGEMMRKRINIGFSSMTGFGPKAWDRDESKVSMHTVHSHNGKQHHVTRGRTAEPWTKDEKSHHPKD